MEEQELRKRVNELLIDQRLAVLSSTMNDQPYPSLVAFAHSDNLQYLFFATLRHSNKYRNIKNNPKISMLIDNRGNSPSDFAEAIAVSVFGTASEMDSSIDQCMDIFLKKHPYLKDFLEMQDCALLKVKVEKFKVISNFQNVDVLVIG
ncbi:pyridoxamine 5'-phosphate oxidase family protein [[Eubacterium] cellulosolvens]